ncbi:PorP/SprF family type IX secretion system membrane protein [Mucilaginibacter myungsuensis]|uniref:PorP/SprF family type IX secretion system membrane protein n=1 Tax=Mucilaginibacter myungsuensis TaxID=649104 RepID=A0A929KTR2_9SPHI|nr:PorP/SprF family type IX secretion system membrane protein [Mucilaginibacter myungsuensis]MBE9660265.1 PorP/SprF family type IX secretion system membrane protein [Mucilaginibacter myungsuensis]MDN3600307.1 PorP/SprF family type IX secretion system membrane protein [Mucilaginibacter myungsuensis]
MKGIVRIILTCVLALGISIAKAQDHQYSQFFNSPVYLNPALNGQFEGDLRMNMIYRNQWTSLGNGPKYFSASIDYNVPQFGGGIGLLFTRGTEGPAYLNKNNLSGIYSYSVGSSDYVLSFGIQAGVTNRSIDYNNLVFSDQIDNRLGFDPSRVSAAEMPVFNNKFYFDTGAGINLVAGNLMIGGAVQHLNKPNESFTGASALLPRRITGHLSYMWDLNKWENIDDGDKSYFIPSVVYYKQYNLNSVSAGIQYKRRSVNAGVYYRSGGEAGRPSAIVFSLIFDIFSNRDTGEKLRFGLSHDAPSSKLSYGNTSGTTEGSFSYETPLNNRFGEYHRFEGARRCYEFY